MDSQTVEQAESLIHTRQRKARWARMNRVHGKYGHDDERTKVAVAAWEEWKRENPSPRPRGRPPSAASLAEPPYQPSDR